MSWRSRTRGGFFVACLRCDAQLPKCISRQPIHARLIQEEVRLERTAEVDRLGHSLDVANVRCPGFQGEVMVTSVFRNGKLVRQWTETVRTILVGEDRCCPVPLVDVEVKDRDATGAEVLDGMQSAHGQIVEHTVS